MSTDASPPPSSYFSNRSGSYDKVVSFRVPADLLSRLSVVGNAEGLGLSDTIRLVLERGLVASSVPPSPPSPEGAASWQRQPGSASSPKKPRTRSRKPK